MKRSANLDEENDLWKRIGLKCYEHFDRLATRGKPSTNEWTHLAAFVAFHRNRHSDQIEILSIGTGTKCLGKEIEERGVNGCLLHDSHAEVIAKRSLQRLFYDLILSKDRSLFDWIDEEKNFVQWKSSIELYLFVSFAPCGLAASIDDPIKRPKLEHKLIESSDPIELRLKPGKGSPTSSLSCTNKIQRWIYQGVEGSLLNQFIRSPIRFSALIIVTSKDLSSLFNPIPVYSIDQPFSFGPSKERIRPSPMSIAWWKTLNMNSPLVTVDGYPLGQVRRLRHQPDYANPLAKVSFFRLYSKLIKDLSIENSTYAQAKSFSSNSLRNEFIIEHPQWLITDPDIFYSFRIHSSQSTI